MKRTRGFTLVELMVSLVAGVIIAVAVVGLAREATNSFYESIRMNAVESSVRVASERLRMDLLRAGFMSTGNIKWDPQVATTPATPPVRSRYASTNDLASVQISVAPAGPAVKNGLAPDKIRIAGNLTSDDAYRGRLKTIDTIEFDANSDPATARLLASASPSQAIANAFAPVAGKKFIVRVVDKHRCTNYVELVANPVSTSGSTFTLKLNGDAGSRYVLLQSEVGTANCGANIGDSDLVVNPVSRVDWWIGLDSDLPAAMQTVVSQGDAGVEDPAYKFNLYRQTIDAADAKVGTAEVVAEFAVDMKFGLVVRNNGVVASDVYKAFDIDVNATEIGTWAGPVSGIANVNDPGPQRIRSIRYVVATRGALADRKADLSASTGPNFRSRYCVNPACTDFARVRTISSEVALLNTERAFY